MGTHKTYGRMSKEFGTNLKEHLAQYEGKDFSAFNNLLAELRTLNLKYLQQLLSDLNKNGAMPPFYGDYHRMLVSSIESTIMERTILK